MRWKIFVDDFRRSNHISNPPIKSWITINQVSWILDNITLVSSCKIAFSRAIRSSSSASWIALRIDVGGSVNFILKKIQISQMQIFPCIQIVRQISTDSLVVFFILKFGPRTFRLGPEGPDRFETLEVRNFTYNWDIFGYYFFLFLRAVYFKSVFIQANFSAVK